MLKLLSILWNSFKMAMQELKVNKLRTFLSLFGITIGIFCIIGVLATVDSLQRKIQGEIKELGTNTIWIDKFDYSENGPNYPYWKYEKRPMMKYKDMQYIKSVVKQSDNVSYFIINAANVSFSSYTLQNVSTYGVSEDFSKIQDLKIASGRYLSEADFERGTPCCVIGYTNAEKLFGEAEVSVGKQVLVNGHQATIVGLLEKQGKSMVGFEYDDCVIISYKFFSNLFDPEKALQNEVMSQANEGIATESLTDELRGIMRQLRRLNPKQQDNFSLNDIKQFSQATDQFFAQVNLGGWAIAGLSLIVGAFGVANIMFVTVRERTSQIGLKKAIGAKNSTILTEFLLESAFLCLLGGLTGLLLVWILSLALTTVLPFAIYIAPNIIFLALGICVVLGILSGIIPATIAARMNPVDAIRTR